MHCRGTISKIPTLHGPPLVVTFGSGKLGEVHGLESLNGGDYMLTCHFLIKDVRESISPRPILSCDHKRVEGALQSMLLCPENQSTRQTQLKICGKKKQDLHDLCDIEVFVVFFSYIPDCLMIKRIGRSIVWIVSQYLWFVGSFQWTPVGEFS